MKRVDHVIVKVDDLHASVAEFKDAGFHIYYGTKREKAYNALIYLQDGSFIELLDPKIIPPFARALARVGVLGLMTPFLNRLANYYFKDGPWLDYPIYSPDIVSTHERIKESSSKIVSNAKREKPNGVVVRWTLFGPKDLDLPFVMSDYSPEKMSDDETNIHPNGITGLSALEVSFADDLEVFMERLVEMYQVERRNVIVERDRFSIQTENARINYTQSNQHRMTAVRLKPANPMLDTKLDKYALSTTNGA